MVLCTVNSPVAYPPTSPGHGCRAKGRGVRWWASGRRESPRFANLLGGSFPCFRQLGPAPAIPQPQRSPLPPSPPPSAKSFSCPPCSFGGHVSFHVACVRYGCSVMHATPSIPWVSENLPTCHYRGWESRLCIELRATERGKLTSLALLAAIRPSC